MPNVTPNPASMRLASSIAPPSGPSFNPLAGIKIFVNEQVSSAVQAASYAPLKARQSFLLPWGLWDPADVGLPGVGSDYIDWILNGSLTLQTLTDWINANVPADWTGPIVPDWEGPWGAITYFGSAVYGSSVFNAAVAKGVLVLNKIRELRPNALVGFYNCPYASAYYPDSNSQWHARNDPLLPLVQASSALFPSLYDTYPNPEEVPESQDLQFVLDNTQLFLELAEHPSLLAAPLPVYPYIWYRWGGGTIIYAFHLIDEPEFINHVSKIFDAVYNTHHAAGIVWWGADEFYHTLSLNPIPAPGTTYYVIAQACHHAFRQEIPHSAGPNIGAPNEDPYPVGYLDWDTYRDAMMTRRLTILSNIVYGTNLALPPLATFENVLVTPAPAKFIFHSAAGNVQDGTGLFGFGLETLVITPQPARFKTKSRIDYVAAPESNLVTDRRAMEFNLTRIVPGPVNIVNELAHQVG